MNTFEQYYLYRNKLEVYSCFIVGAKVKKPFAKDVLLKHVSDLIERRKLLKVNFMDGKRVEVNVDINTVVEFIEENECDIIELIDKLHNTVFKTDVSNVLWKLVVHGQWILLLCEHTLYDGTTAKFILDDLLSLISHEEIPPDKALEADELVTPSYWYIIKSVFAQLFKRSNPWMIGEKNTTTFHTLKKLIQLNVEEFSKLKIILKREKISLTALLAYYNLRALDKSPITMSVPVNLRKFLPEEYQRSYGLCVSEVSMTLTTNNMDWNYARWIGSRMSQSAQKESAQLVGLLSYIDYRELLQKKLQSPRSTVLEISNLGRGNSNSVDEFIFSQPNSHTGPLICNDVVSSDSTINILVSAAPESEPMFTEYVTELENLLKA
jgi:hypothetical protein